MAQQGQGIAWMSQGIALLTNFGFFKKEIVKWSPHNQEQRRVNVDFPGWIIKS